MKDIAILDAILDANACSSLLHMKTRGSVIHCFNRRSLSAIREAIRYH